MSNGQPPIIIFIIPNLGNQGIQIIWLIKIKEYQKLGYKTYIHGGNYINEIKTIGDVYSYDNKHHGAFSKPKINKSKISYLLYAIRQNILSLGENKEISKISPDIIYSFSSVLDFIIVPFVYKLTNKKVVWCTVFDNTVPIFGRGNTLIRLLAWLFFQISIPLLSQADCIFTVTTYLKRYLIRRGLSEKHIAVTGNGVESELIKKIKKGNKYRSDGLFMGRLNESKGIFDLLKVLEIVKRDHPKFTLSIMGSGDKKTEEAFKEQIIQTGLENNIKFLGYQSGVEKYSYLGNTKSFWFLSYDESFGVALLEAVALGRQCFTYSLPIFKQLYTDKQVSMHKTGDIQSVASAVIKLFRDNKFTNTEGKKMAKKHDWNLIVEKESRLISNFT